LILIAFREHPLEGFPRMLESPFTKCLSILPAQK
jgi:hypothetical protein